VSIDDLAEAIRAAYAGRSTLAAEATQALVQAASPSPPKIDHDLTERQLDVLALMVEGLSNNEIAERLTLSPYIVRNHVSDIFSRLGAANRTEAVALAVQHGLVG
jgi:NarL family two-component system response regulator LiaR